MWQRNAEHLSMANTPCRATSPTLSRFSKVAVSPRCVSGIPFGCAFWVLYPPSPMQYAPPFWESLAKKTPSSCSRTVRKASLLPLLLPSGFHQIHKTSFMSQDDSIYSPQDRSSIVGAQWQMRWYFPVPISYPLAVLCPRESIYKVLMLEIKLSADHFS